MNQAQRQQNYQNIRQQPQPHEYHPAQQQQQTQPVYQSNFQPYQQPQDYSYQQPPSVSPSFQANIHYPTERKPVLLQPSYPTEESNTPAPIQQQQPVQNQVQQQQQPVQNNYRQPSYRPQQPSLDSYQQQFENYVVPDRNKDYSINVDFNRNNAYTPEPNKEETPSWVIETQPPTQYRKQKPYDAITFSTESYKSTTAPSKALKYRPKLTTKAQEPTPSPISIKEDTSGQIYIKHDRKKLYDQLVSSQTTPLPKVTTPSPTVARSTTKSSKSEEELIQEELQRQIQAQLGAKDDIFKTLKITLPGSLSSDQIANLPNLALGDKLEQYQIPQLPLVPGLNEKSKTASVSSKGPQIKTVVLQAPPSATVKPPKAVSFEELTKGVLPPGADFEVIRQKQDGALEEVGKLKDLAQKKVTFVILEEQPDGSVKVQGVRGNENGPTETKGAEVDSIIQKIQKGEIKLPPSGPKKSPPNTTPEESVASPSYVKHSGKSDQTKRRFTTRAPSFHSTLLAANSPFQENKKDAVKSKAKYQSPTRSTFLPTIAPQQEEKLSPVYKSTTEHPFLDFNYSQSQTSSANTVSASTPYSHPPTGPAIYEVPTGSSVFPTQPRTYTQSPVYQATPSSVQYTPLPTAYTDLPSSTQLDIVTPKPTHFSSLASPASVLADTLKKNGFFAMAKFLRQSGLETVLNETG